MSLFHLLKSTISALSALSDGEGGSPHDYFQLWELNGLRLMD